MVRFPALQGTIGCTTIKIRRHDKYTALNLTQSIQYWCQQLFFKMSTPYKKIVEVRADIKPYNEWQVVQKKTKLKVRFYSIQIYVNSLACYKLSFCTFLPHLFAIAKYYLFSYLLAQMC